MQWITGAPGFRVNGDRERDDVDEELTDDDDDHTGKGMKELD